MASLLCFAGNLLPQPPLQLWVATWPSSNQWVLRGTLLGVLEKWFPSCERDKHGEELPGTLPPGITEAKRITEANLKPWHLFEDSNDIEGWVGVNQLEKGRKKVWASENIVDTRSNAERRPRKAGSESDHEDFVRSNVIYCHDDLIQNWGWFPCLLIHYQSMTGIFSL